MTPRQKLKELLLPLGTIPDGLDSLLETAGLEIMALRETIVSQKNGLAFKQTELDQRNVSLGAIKADLQAANTLLEHERLIVRSQRDANTRLIDEEAKLNHEVMRLRAELVAKNAELARLRPPEPKFRVGQVVVRIDNGNSYTVRHRQRNIWSGQWEYCNCKCAPSCYIEWTPEAQLRALTDEEK